MINLFKLFTIILLFSCNKNEEPNEGPQEQVKQDTLDRDLSAGERGVISYLKFVNQGSADANALRVTLSSDSDYIQFEDQDMLSFDLNTHSSFLDERSGDCPSRLLENDGYCYRRPEAYFNISTFQM